MKKEKLKKDRITINLDSEVARKVRKIQANIISKNDHSYPFSKAIEDLLIKAMR